MQLFQFKNYNVVFEPQVMMIREFAAIRDKNKDEELTLKEVSFIWFYTDVRSDFQNIIDDEERLIEVIQSIGLPKGWKPSKEILDAIELYKEYSVTPSSGLYNASITAAKFIENKMRNPQTLLDEVDGKGAKIYKLDTILKMIKDIPDVMTKLHTAREQVVKELESKTGLKGGKKKSIFEDGIG
jgi:hypothetical protein